MQLGAAQLLTDAIARNIFPGAVAEVGSSRGALWQEAFGHLTFEPDSPPADATTIFDLASLAKPIATATLAVSLVQRGALDLDETLTASFPEWRGADRENVTVRDLLEHASGLPARLVDAPPQSRREFEHEICGVALEYEPRTRSLYSDLGFILLGFLIEARGRSPLDVQFDALWHALENAAGAGAFLGFHPPASSARRVAPTRPLPDDVRRGEVLTGEVHDNYAAALGGVAGHAGLFGTASSVGAFARAMLDGARESSGAQVPFDRESVALATTKSRVPGSSRALGWDTMLPTSSCGTLLSPAAFGHVGFTGTSLWIDPVLDRYFVLLTNRAYGNGSIEDMRNVRRAFHDALATIDG